MDERKSIFELPHVRQNPEAIKEEFEDALKRAKGEDRSQKIRVPMWVIEDALAMIKKYDEQTIPDNLVCRANRKDNGETVDGYYFCMHHNDGRKHIHHFLIPFEADLSIGTPIEKIQVEIDPYTIHLKYFDYLRQSKDFEIQSKDEPILLENQHKPYGISTNANSPWISRCPRCGKKVEGKQTRFCKYCGQAVKWE